jgi:hypothetical protein
MQKFNEVNTIKGCQQISQLLFIETDILKTNLHQ